MSQEIPSVCLLYQYQLIHPKHRHTYQCVYGVCMRNPVTMGGPSPSILPMIFPNLSRWTLIPIEHIPHTEVFTLRCPQVTLPYDRYLGQFVQFWANSSILCIKFICRWVQSTIFVKSDFHLFICQSTITCNFVEHSILP